MAHNASQAIKVSEIFTSAGKAFNTLGDLILQVQTDKESNSKWSQEEVDMLKTSVTKFNEDLNQLSSHIKAKQTSQIRQTLKSKSYQQAGLANKVDTTKPTTIQIHPQPPPVIIQEQVIFQPQSIKIEQSLPETLVQVHNATPTTSQITLNRLNAQQEEIEMDVGAFQDGDVKIEYTTEVS